MLLLAGHVYETQYLDAPADNVPAGVSCRVAVPTIKTTLIVTNSPTSGVGGRNTTCQQLQLLIYNKNKWIQVPSFGTKITNIDVRLTRELKCLRGPRSGGGEVVVGCARCPDRTRFLSLHVVIRCPWPLFPIIYTIRTPPAVPHCVSGPGVDVATLHLAPQKRFRKPLLLLGFVFLQNVAVTFILKLFKSFVRC